MLVRLYDVAMTAGCLPRGLHAGLSRVVDEMAEHVRRGHDCQQHAYLKKMGAVHVE